jgi:hypothetical protein
MDGQKLDSYSNKILLLLAVINMLQIIVIICDGSFRSDGTVINIFHLWKNLLLSKDFTGMLNLCHIRLTL